MTEHNNDTDNEQIEINPDASGIEKFDSAEKKLKNQKERIMPKILGIA